MRRLAPHLRLAGAVRISNVWLLESPGGGRFLIDTGHPVERPGLALGLWRAGLRGPGDVSAVLLTHRHSDHAGNAAWLRRRFACPVVCHERDAPFLSGRVPPPPLARGVAPFYIEALNLFEDRFPARCPVDEVYEEGVWKWGLRVLPTPGHTEGSSMLLHEPTGTLFSGDSIVVGIPPLGWPAKLLPAIAGFSLDPRRCHAALAEFLRDPPPVETLAAGHGPALFGGLREKLRSLAERLQA